jgi:hypothetical protein
VISVDVVDTQRKSKTIASPRVILAGGAALLLGLFVYYYFVCYRDYILSYDAVAFVGALSSPKEWFAEGWLHYFEVYPGWSSQDQWDLVRPLANVIGYANHALFGERYALYFAVFYLAQLGGLALFLRLLREASIPALPAAGMALLYVVNPAFVNDGLTLLPFHFDVIAAQLTLAAFLALWLGRNGLSLVFLTSALFTKESAAFAPIAAAISILIWGRDRRLSLLMLLPIVMWAGLRFFAFGNVFGTRLSSPLESSAVGLLVWPTGMVPADVALDIENSVPLARHDFLWMGPIAANFGFWLLLLYAAYVTARGQLVPSMRADQSAQLSASFLVWTLGALAFGVLVGPHSRYGASYYPFLYLFLANWFFAPGGRIPRWVVAAVLLVLSTATAFQIQRVLRAGAAWESYVAPERALHDALRALPQDGQTVYIVNAPRTHISSPRYLNSAWSTNLHVVIVNNAVSWSCSGPSDQGVTEFDPSANALLNVRIPACASFAFAGVASDLIAGGIRGPVARDGVGLYRFPEGSMRTGTMGTGTRLDLGHRMRFQIDPAQHPIVLAYNWATGDYTRVVEH